MRESFSWFSDQRGKREHPAPKFQLRTELERNANIERRTSNRRRKREHRTSNRRRKREHRTPNVEPKKKTRTSNIERRTSNVELKKIKERKKTPSVCSFRFLCSTLDVRSSMFGVRIHSSDVRCSYSFFRCEVFVFILPMFGVRIHSSDVRCSYSFFRCEVFLFSSI